MHLLRLNSILPAFVFVAELVLGPCASPQRSLAPTLAESPRVLSLQRGTLTLVLANKHGFVIASDSRRTFFPSKDSPDEICGDGQRAFADNYSTDVHCDDSQKLFRLGPYSAMAIAGFAGVSREPFATDVAAEVTKDLFEYTDDRAVWWAKTTFESRFRLIDWINQANGGKADDLNLYVTIARIADNGVPQITTLTFKGNNGYENPAVGKISGTTFQCVPFGVTDLAAAVCNGTYNGRNPHLRKLRSVIRHGRQDMLSVGEMTKIASAAILETSHLSSTVGGPTQLGVFGVHKQPVWKQQAFAQRRQTLGDIMFYDGVIGAVPPVSTGVPGEHMFVVRGGLYVQGETVSVDGNAYIHCTFLNSTIVTEDISPIYWRANNCEKSYWLRPGHKPIPLDMRCEPQLMAR